MSFQIPLLNPAFQPRNPNTDPVLSENGRSELKHVRLCFKKIIYKEKQKLVQISMRPALDLEEMEEDMDAQLDHAPAETGDQKDPLAG